MLFILFRVFIPLMWMGTKIIVANCDMLRGKKRTMLQYNEYIA